MGGKSKNGFTIVELLIVIAVIGVLAALVLNSFSDAQRKARNAQTASLVTAYKKALTVYVTTTNSYPTTNVCLGTGYPSGSCWTGPNGTRNENAGFNTQLKPYIGLAPQVTAKTIDYTGLGDFRSGAVFNYNAAKVLDGVSQPVYFISYHMEGTAEKCLVGPVLAEVNGGADYSSVSPVSGYTQTYGNGSVQCIVKLPTPGSL